MLVKGAPGDLDQYYGSGTMAAGDSAQVARLSTAVSRHGTDFVAASEGTLKHTGEIGHSPNEKAQQRMDHIKWFMGRTAKSNHYISNALHLMNVLKRASHHQSDMIHGGRSVQRVQEQGELDWTLSNESHQSLFETSVRIISMKGRLGHSGHKNDSTFFGMGHCA